MALSVVLHSDHLNALFVALRREFNSEKVELNILDLSRDTVFGFLSTAAGMLPAEVQDCTVGNVLFGCRRL